MRVLNRSIWPYTQTIVHSSDSIIVDQMDDWCKTTVGKTHAEWFSYELSNSNQRVYAFKSEEDLVVFKLKWENQT